MYKRGLVALSADPVHNGHINLVTSAKNYCDKLFVSVANNDEKKYKYLFSMKERTDFVRRALSGMVDVEVIESPTQILSDTYLHYGCDGLFRGIRDDKDQVYEETQMGYHKMICPQLEPVYLSFRKNENISSTLVKSFTSHHIDVSKLVPIFVKRRLEETICKQYKIAVTGGIAVGKSWVTDKLVTACNKKFTQYVTDCRRDFGITDMSPFKATAIKFDELIRAVYDDPAPGPVQMRIELDLLCSKAGSKVSTLHPDGTVDRVSLSKFMFESASSDLKLEIQKLTQPFVEAKYREALKNAGAGLIVIEWAQLAEMEVGYWSNNNTIVVDSADRDEFVRERNISSIQLANVSKTQWNAESKTRALEFAAKKDGEGNIIQFINSIKDNKMNELTTAVLSLFKFQV